MDTPRTELDLRDIMALFTTKLPKFMTMNGDFQEWKLEYLGTKGFWFKRTLV